jgi:tetratricopeptide (TPR) repeat protein
MTARWILAALLLVGAGAAPAAAHGGGTDPNTDLLLRGHALLRKAEAAWLQGDAQRARGHALGAVRRFEDVLNRSPRNPTAAFLACEGMALAGDAPHALTWLQRYMEFTGRGATDPDANFLRAFVAIIAEKRPERGVRSLERMFSLAPQARATERDNLWVHALGDLGRQYMEAGKAAEAARRFATGVRIARRLGSRVQERIMLANLGAAYLRDERYIEAGEIYLSLTKAEPGNALWHYRYGSVLANQSKFAEAVKAYRGVLDLKARKAPSARDPEVDEVRMRVGNCLRWMADRERDPKRAAALYKQSREYLKVYVAAHPRDARGEKWLGFLLLDHFELPYEALPHLRKAFELDPACDDAERYLIQLMSRYGPPKGTEPAAWKAELERLRKDWDANHDARDAEQRRRERLTGSRGCA